MSTMRRLFGGKSKISAQERAEAQKALEQHVLTWDEKTVSVWLEATGLGDHVKAFQKNSINGEALAALTDDDLVSMKIDKLGMRKNVLRAVEELTQTRSRSTGESASKAAKAKDASEKSSTTASSTASSKTSINALRFPVLVTDDSAAPRFEVALNPDKDVSFNSVARKVQRRLGLGSALTVLSVRGAPGHLPGAVVPLEDHSDWAPIWAVARKGGEPMEFLVRRASPNELGKNERTMLEGLVDACVVADAASMRIIFVNRALLKLTNYETSEVTALTVEHLMPREVAAHHAGYVRAYLQTGTAKVIGKGRQVALVRRDKSIVNCWLTVTEQRKAGTGRHTFTGMLHEMTVKLRADPLINYSVLDAVQKVVVVTDQNGIIRFMNRYAEALLGWSEDACGQNVAVLMPQPYSQQHSSYMGNYVKSGKAKVLGKGVRTVVAMRKDGSVVPVDLSLDEVSLNGQRHFVATLKETSQQQDARSVIQDTRGVVNSLSVPAVVIDKDGRIQAFNAKAEQLLGYGLVDVLGEKVQILMNEKDAARHDSYMEAYRRTGVGKVLGSTRIVMAKTVDGMLLPVSLSLSKSVNPDDPEEYFFTAILTPSQVNDKGEKSSESTSYGAAERNYKQMNSAGENTVTACTAVRDFAAADDANVKHRPSMEDAWVMMDEFGKQSGHAFFGLYDGHGGPEAADFTMEKLHLFLAKLSTKQDAPSALKQAFALTHEAMGSDIGRSGCTALVGWLQGKTLHVAHVGDSRAVLVSPSGAATRLTRDHKPSDPIETKLIESKGGLIMNGRISGILAVSRSLGDYRANRYVSREPDVTSVPVEANASVVLACDGLWDVCTDEEVGEAVRRGIAAKQTAAKIAKSLVDTAIAKGSRDNVSVLLLLF